MPLSCAQVPCVTYFDAQLQILDLLEHKAIFTAGYKAILHLHSLVEECEITRLLAQIDIKTKEKKKARLIHCPRSSGLTPCKRDPLQILHPQSLVHSHRYTCLALSSPAGAVQASRVHTERTGLSALEVSASCRCDFSCCAQSHCSCCR